uniref:Uncharacterized protein n=1 Tax=Arundo donax TaxID=35708 RepID=A0A0A9FZE4_ARUDO
MDEEETETGRDTVFCLDLCTSSLQVATSLHLAQNIYSYIPTQSNSLI